MANEIKTCYALLSFELQIHLVSKAKNGSFKIAFHSCNAIYFTAYRTKKMSPMFICVSF